MTFGWGVLDASGYWEYGCAACAAHWNQEIKETKSTIYKRMIKEGHTHQEAMEYLNEEPMLNNPAWPY
jgi:hypothetical protein